jgi:phosphoribosylformylglycinamidine cyclo-ligase
VGETYAGAGVSIDAGDEAVARIKPLVRSTYRPEVLGDIGGFGGLFDVASLGYRHPVLVSSTDGVGTKALVAAAARRYDTIGLDLVAMCVDDLVCQGAQPLFFLDYISIGVLDPAQVEQLVSGVADGCRRAGCALIGGEMAEHPGVMAPGEFDLVGFSVGVAERDALITGARVAPGDVLVGLPSPNLRSNGFSLARRVLFDVAGRALDDPAWPGATTTVADELLAPSVIYAPAVLDAIGAADVHAVAHITGGGLPGNLRRVLSPGADAVVDTTTWDVPPIFAEIQRLGAVEPDEMRRVFNCGIGMVLVVAAPDADRAREALAAGGHDAVVIGEVVPGEGAVRLS